MNRHLPLVPEHAKGRDIISTSCGTTNTRIEGTPIVDVNTVMGGVQDTRWMDNGQDGWTEGLSLRARTRGGRGTELVIRDPAVAEHMAAQLLDGAIRLRLALERGQRVGEKVLNRAGA